MDNKREEFVAWFNSLPPQERVEVWYLCEAQTASEFRTTMEERATRIKQLEAELAKLRK